jgi:hypothetical protein
MRSIKCWGLQQACVALVLCDLAVIKVNAATDAAAVMKERLVF